ncbi:hypothetical protein QVM88_15175 [Providencia stuartii]|uniref:hypothetical protein n=1 Tax=Providencia stuartii TaxID=588 RepID=UPI0025AB2287|nr:hypothetical protein [Providencia stuartii]MDN0007664.1 hypothetical protein [Providencia stuartii]
MDKLDDVRAVFEKLYKEQTVFIENTHGYDSQKFSLWAGFQLGWQASRDSLINNLEPVGYITPVSGLLLRRKQKSFIYPEKTETNIPLYRLD